MTTGADFLLMTTGARPDGMGQAFSAVADDINTLSFNPAGLGNIRLPEVGYGHESFVADINYDFLGAAIPLGPAGVLGLGYLNLGTAPFNSTVNPSAPAVSASDRALMGGWGRSFYGLQVGVAAKYITRQLGGVQGTGFGFDAGLRVRPLAQLTLAASVLNLGTGIQLASLEPLPTLIHAGIAWEAVETSSSTLNLAANAAVNLPNRTQQFGLGAEYWFKEAVALRAGYLFNTLDADFNPDGFSAGAGIRISFVQLDYAFQPFNTLGMVHRFSGMVRWDGPWVAGGEPNPPRHVNVVQDGKDLVVRWEKALGPAQGYEVTLQPMDGREATLSPVVANPYYEFKPVTPGTLYKISVRTVGAGGGRSFPSEETYLETKSSQDLARQMGGDGEGRVSESQGVHAKVDGIGLRLYWENPRGVPFAGFNLYRESPAGTVEKVTQEVKRGDRCWITDTSGLRGYKWIVTLVDSKGREGTLGSYRWYPSPSETESLFDLEHNPVVRLQASPEPDHRVFLDWDRVPGAAGYTLFLSHKADGVFEYLKDVDRNKATLLIKASHQHDFFYFLIAPKSPGGGYLRRSSQAKVDLQY